MMSTPSTISRFRLDESTSCGSTVAGRKLAKHCSPSRNCSKPRSGRSSGVSVSHLYLHACAALSSWLPGPALHKQQSMSKAAPADGCQQNGIAVTARLQRLSRQRLARGVNGGTSYQRFSHLKGLAFLLASRFQNSHSHIRNLWANAIPREQCYPVSAALHWITPCKQRCAPTASRMMQTSNICP